MENNNTNTNTNIEKTLDKQNKPVEQSINDVLNTVKASDWKNYIEPYSGTCPELKRLEDIVKIKNGKLNDAVKTHSYIQSLETKEELKEAQKSFNKALLNYNNMVTNIHMNNARIEYHAGNYNNPAEYIFEEKSLCGYLARNKDGIIVEVTKNPSFSDMARRYYDMSDAHGENRERLFDLNNVGKEVKILNLRCILGYADDNEMVTWSKKGKNNILELAGLANELECYKSELQKFNEGNIKEMTCSNPIGSKTIRKELARVLEALCHGTTLKNCHVGYIKSIVTKLVSVNTHGKTGQATFEKALWTIIYNSITGTTIEVEI